MITINHVANLFKVLKLRLFKRNFQKHPLKTPFPLLNSEGVKFLSLNYLNSPEMIRVLFENFISAFKTLSFCCELQKRTRKPPGLRLEEAYFEIAKTGREDNDTSA